MPVTFTTVAPVLPVRDVAAALAHYARLGFKTHAYRDPGVAGDPPYGFVSWGPVELHVARVTNLDPCASTSACYLYVDDADALHSQWCASGAEGRFTNPEDTPYALREFAHIDPDGNLLRVGSPLAK
jgi:hypothetical protein